MQPEVLRRIEEPVRLPAEVEEAFLRDNPHLADACLTGTCRSGHVQEIRVCLTPELEPRDCARDIRRDCDLADAVLLPVD